MPKLDAALNLLLPKPEVFSNDGFAPNQSITDVFRSEGAKDALTVIVPPWHANPLIQTQVRKTQQAHGQSIIAYSLHDDILSADADRTMACFQYVGEQIAKSVAEYRKAHPTAQISYIAASLGCAVLMYAMGTQQLSGNVDLVVPGGNLASGLWHGIRTQHLRKAFEQQGISENDLRTRWAKLAPTRQALNIHDSLFRIFCSRTDLVIPPDTIPGLVANLEVHNRVEVLENKHLGHFGTIALQTLLQKQAA